MCTTSFHPPLKKYYFASARELAKLPPTVHSNCSEAVCLAARTFATGIVIFIKYRKVSTYIILLNLIGNYRGSVVFAKERRRKRMLRKRTSGKFWVASIRLPWPTRIILQATKIVLACSHSHSLQLPCTVGGNQASVANLKFWSPRQRGGWSWSCPGL